MRILYTFYGHFNALFGLYSFIFISFAKIIVALDSSYINTYTAVKRLRVQVSIPFIAKDIAIIRILMTGGGHLEFYHEKMDEKNGNSFFQFFRVNINEKTQLFKIYMKKSQNMYLLHNSVYY